MIRITDALLLAATKLRARKVRTIFTIAIAGILFGVVVAITLVSDGALQSTERMMSKSMTGRYIVSGSPILFQNMGDIMNDPQLIERAQAEYKQLVADKKEEAK